MPYTSGEFLNAAATGDVLTVKEYLAANTKNTDINAITDASGNNALILAAKNGCSEVVLTLLKAPNITATQRDNDGYSALMYAVTRCNIETLQALLTVTKLDVNAQCNTSGWTALMFAVSFSNTPAVEILLQDKRVNLMIRNHSEHTAKDLLHAHDEKQHIIIRLFNEAERSRNAANINLFANTTSAATPPHDLPNDKTNPQFSPHHK
jgi:ankyrin repeat protein